MNSIDTYIDRAMEKNGISSEVKLCVALGLSKSQVNYWRKRKSIPSPESMVRLSKMAGMDVNLALLELEFWRAASRNEARAASQFKKMIDRWYPEAA